MQQYVVSYDISDDKTRLKAAKKLLRFGQRVQFSVFEIAIRDTNQLGQLQDEMQELFNTTDQIRYYRLCQTCRAASTDESHQAIVTFPASKVL